MLSGLDYEHDDMKTPRIAAVVDLENRTGSLGIVRGDAILIRPMKPRAGEAFYLATYAHDHPDERFRDDDFDVSSAEEACEYVLEKGVFARLDLPVSAVCAVELAGGFHVSHKNL